MNSAAATALLTIGILAGSLCFPTGVCWSEPTSGSSPLAGLPHIPLAAPGLYAQAPAAPSPEKQLLVLFSPQHMRIVSPNNRQAVLATDPVERPKFAGTMAAFCDDVKITPQENPSADEKASQQILFAGNCRVRGHRFQATADKISYSDGWFLLEGNAELTTISATTGEPHRATAWKIKFHPDNLNLQQPPQAQGARPDGKAKS